MGQYHYLVNLDKKEFVHPHKLGVGLKLWEQLASHPSTGTALIILLASASNGSGGGDLQTGPSIIGSWRGDRIAFIGDYDDDVKYKVGRDKKSTMIGAKIYQACGDESDWRDVSEPVCAVIETELRGKYSGDGWREFKYGDGSKSEIAQRPDMLLSVPKL